MPHGTTRFKEKREAILDGAARLFNQQGIRGGTLADVARSVGLATNSITYYYRRKEDLACACLQRAMDAMSQDAATAVALANTLDGRVRGFLARHLGRLADIAEGRHPELLVFSDLLTLAPPHDARMAEAYTAMFRQVRAVLEAPDAPPLARDALNARAHLLLSTASWARAWVGRFEPLDYPVVAARIADLLLDGLAAAATPDDPTPGPGQGLSLPASATGAADDTATAYLRAATRLVNEHGYHGASVDRIAAELQLTKGSFYHHHNTKEDLIAACFERTFAVVRAAQSAALALQAADGRPLSGLARLGLACRTLLDFQLGPLGPLLRLTAWTALPEAIRRDTQRTMGRLGERFASFVIDGMADGSVRVMDPSVAAQVVNGMINAAAEMQRWARGLHAGNAFALYALPLFTGLRRAPPTAELPADAAAADATAGELPHKAAGPSGAAAVAQVSAAAGAAALASGAGPQAAPRTSRPARPSRRGATR